MELPPINERLSSYKTFFLAGYLNDISLVTYDRNINRFLLFEHFITHALASDYRVLYAYYSTNLIARFKEAIQKKQVIPYELREGHQDLEIILNDLSQHRKAKKETIFFVIDYSRETDFQQTMDLIQKMKSENNFNCEFTGIIAFQLDLLNDDQIQELSVIFPTILFLSGDTNLISFPALPNCKYAGGIVPEDIIDVVVRHSLEQLILMYLNQDVTGFDIIKKISECFHVDIPIARVYSFLYELEDKGFVSAQVRGRAKIYSLTATGRDFAHQRILDFEAAHKYVLGYRD
ncbi:MAG: helix-turn-helix transcriptional regulator [Spirochaetes bacterium]|nr:helix-turn-helix transcriptional regulator [Spirochaetota bacterium]